MNIPITHQIYDKIFELLDKNPDDLCWTDLLKKVKRVPDSVQDKYTP